MWNWFFSESIRDLNEAKMQEIPKSFLIKDLLRDLIHTADTETGTRIYFSPSGKSFCDFIISYGENASFHRIINRSKFKHKLHVFWCKSHQSHYVNEFDAISQR